LQDIFDDILKALSIKGMMVILNTSNFLEIGTLLPLRPGFLSPPALRLTPPEVFPCLVPACPG